MIIGGICAQQLTRCRWPVIAATAGGTGASGAVGEVNIRETTYRAVVRYPLSVVGLGDGSLTTANRQPSTATRTRQPPTANRQPPTATRHPTTAPAPAPTVTP